MSEIVRCPGCGAVNPIGAEACSQCNFPLAERPPAPAVAEPAVRTESAETSAPFFDIGPRPVRRRSRPDAMEPVQMQLWLFAGVAVVMGIIYFAAQGFWNTNVKPVEGAVPEQQQRADQARTALAKDSTNVAARIELANVLYDTGNWSEAIVHYRSALRVDPSRSTTVVDLGVCYYNLGATATAETLFRHALELDPHQVVAMFNLGIVAESRGRWDEALSQYHSALQADPPEAMKSLLQQHLAEAMAKSGKRAPPLKP